MDERNNDFDDEERIDAPHFSCRILEDSTIEFWCPGCSQWHVHSWDPQSDPSHRVPHCRTHREIYTDGYFVTACGAYDDDEWTRSKTKKVNIAEFQTWNARRMDQIERWREHDARYKPAREHILPMFSARLSDGYLEFWCTPCQSFHRHFMDWDPTNIDHVVNRVLQPQCDPVETFHHGYYLKPITEDVELKDLNQWEFDNWIKSRIDSVKERRMPAAIVKFYKDGDNMSISTNASSEEQFLDEAIAQLAQKIEAGEHTGDWLFQLERWIPQLIEVTCKLRGYKADVFEERIITSGHYLPAEVVKAFSKTA